MSGTAKFWIIGIILAVAGVVLARVISPRLAGQALLQLILFFLGVLTAMGGLGIILMGLRRK
jgi:hypothetical protein